MADGVFGANSYVRPFTAFGSPRIVHRKVGSTVSTALFAVGDAVVAASSDFFSVVLHSTGVTADRTAVMGFAGEAASSTDSTSVTKPIFAVSPETQFIGVAKGTIASTNLGKGYALRRDSTLAIPYIDLAVAATATMCIVDDLAEGTRIGDTNGYVVFHVIDAGRQYIRSTT